VSTDLPLWTYGTYLAGFWLTPDVVKAIRTKLSNGYPQVIEVIADGNYPDGK
jgi:hypothetical protein